MNRTRVIIADEDYGYVIPIMTRFAEKFFDRIDLVIITNKDYFCKLLQTPQSGDVLVISENLYNDGILRHDFTHVFILTEQEETDLYGVTDVTLLYKYSNLKELINIIIGSCPELSATSSDGENEPQVITVASAYGGAGKTTVAMGIASCLSENRKRTLYINASYLQTFQYFMQDDSCIQSNELYGQFTMGEVKYKDFKHCIRYEKFHYLPPFKMGLMSLGLSFAIYEQIVLEAQKSGDYDYIVVDLENVVSEDSIRLFDIANKVMVITEQTDLFAKKTGLLMRNLNGVNADKYYTICNKFNRGAVNSLLAKNIMVNEYIPFDDALANGRLNDISKLEGVRKTAFLVM